MQFSYNAQNNLMVGIKHDCYLALNGHLLRIPLVLTTDLNNTLSPHLIFFLVLHEPSLFLAMLKNHLVQVDCAQDAPCDGF